MYITLRVMGQLFSTCGMNRSFGPTRITRNVMHTLNKYGCC
jgi:hypothetical protein